MRISHILAVLSFDRCRADLDRAAVRRELDGIDNNVIQRFFQEFGIRPQDGKGIDIRVKLERKLTRFQVLRVILLDEAQDRSQESRFRNGAKAPGFRAAPHPACC